jgi:hypothetical protein
MLRAGEQALRLQLYCPRKQAIAKARLRSGISPPFAQTVGYMPYFAGQGFQPDIWREVENEFLPACCQGLRA